MSEANEIQFVDTLAARYQQALHEAGYDCTVQVNSANNTKVLVVEFDGVNLLLVLDYDDPAFVRVLLYNFCNITQKQLPVAFAVMAEVTKSRKCAKVFFNDTQDNTTACVEFLENGNSVDIQMLVRTFKSVVDTAKTFVGMMAENEEHWAS